MTKKPNHQKSRRYMIIAGPTASGKSAMAIDIARKLNGVIINADSMQIYHDLSVLTARPSEADMQAVPHRLYGVMDGAENCSVGKWLALAHDEVGRAWQDGQMPILVGGTGMYLQAALEGISPIPDIPQEVRKAVIAQHQKIGADAFHAMLASLDAEIAERLFPTDTQRVLRAMEVVTHTGIPLSEWQKKPRVSMIEAEALSILHLPPRQEIYQRIEARFDRMIEAGALDEVACLRDRQLDPDLPVMKALGVKILLDNLAGLIDEEEAIERVKRDTRRYAKRQMTWLRNNFISKIDNNKLYSESLSEKIFSKIFDLT